MTKQRRVFKYFYDKRCKKAALHIYGPEVVQDGNELKFGLRTSDLGGSISCLLWSANRMTSEAFMFTFSPMKRWQGFALLLWTIQVPAFAEGIDLQNTRSFQGGPINDETVSQLRVKWVYQTVQIGRASCRERV